MLIRLLADMRLVTPASWELGGPFIVGFPALRIEDSLGLLICIDVHADGCQRRGSLSL